MPVIDQDVPALARIRLNEILDADPTHRRYVVNTLSEFNEEMRSIDYPGYGKVTSKKFRLKAIKLFTAAREASINDSSLPEPVRTHLLNLVQTIGKIRMRELFPKYAVVDENGKLLSKWYGSFKSASSKKIKIHKSTGKEGVVASWNQHRWWLYDNRVNQDPTTL